MVQRHLLNRRQFLFASAAAAGAAMLAGCTSDDGKGGGTSGGASGKGSATEPLKPPAEFKEAPMLKALVDKGQLPPVKDRLPQNPYVLPHNWLEAGKYGGTLRTITPSTYGDQGNLNREFMYGHSLLRWLNDGKDVGPGLVESWESNDDASEWTLHFRKGLKWSDGKPWTTRDIMFWWEDVVLNDDHSQLPPDEARSGKGTLCQMTAKDDTTLVMKFDAPAPLTADRLAMWTNGGKGDNGPIWMLPRHYVEQFHPKYNSNAPKNWAAPGGPFELNSDYARNPNCPTMTGWKLKEFAEGRQLVWERNPYYWVVAKDGSQLPYIDNFVMTAVQDPEVGKLQIAEGKVDYSHGPFNKVVLTDIKTMKESESRAGTEVLLWDSGSGTGSLLFVNYDHRDPKQRALFRQPRFRQALSLAFNRDEARKSVYFNTGEKTTGTLSPKAIEYQINDEGKKVYQSWRDSYAKFDPEQAKKLLDEIGMVDKNNDGKRELPDGTPFVLRIDVPADADDEHVAINELRKRDWEAIGIAVQINPLSPEGYDQRWKNGELTTRCAWEVGDGPNHLVYPQWLVPIEAARWAPLEGKMYEVRGTPAETSQKNVDPFLRTPPRMEAEAGGPIEKLWQLYDQSKVEPDEMKRHKLVWDMIKVHVEHGPFFIGTVANYPRVIIKKKDLRNIPRKENLALGGFVNPWIHPNPAVYDPEAYFWQNPDQHK